MKIINEQDFRRALYYDPHKSNTNKNFFRFKKEHKDTILRNLNDGELLLLINLWIHNHIDKVYNLKNNDINTIGLGNKKVEIYNSSLSPHLKKLRKNGLIEIKGRGKKRNIPYDYEKNNNFRNIPLSKVFNWLEVSKSPNHAGFRTYFYFLYRFYNEKNLSINDHGVRKLKISASEISSALSIPKNKNKTNSNHKLNITPETARRHCNKIVNLGLLDVKKDNGNTNVYYLPFISTDYKIITAKTIDKSEIPKSIIEKYQL